MLKYFKKFLFVFLLPCLLFAPAGCISGQGSSDIGETEGDDFKVLNFYFSHNGMSSYDCYNYTVKQVGNIPHVTVDCVGAKEPLRRNADQRLTEDLTKLLKECQVISWNGFNKVANGVLDGSGFSLTMELADGRKITAHGSNSFPKGYQRFKQKLDEMFLPYKRSLMEKNTSWREPEDAVSLNMVSIDQYREQDDGTILRERRLYLSPEDEQKYPKLAERLQTINREISEGANEGSRILLTVRADSHITSLALYEQPAKDIIAENCRIKTYNINTKTGEDIKLQNIIHRKSDFCLMNRNELRARYGEKTFTNYQELPQQLEKDFDKLTFALGYEGLIFYFQPGEIAPKEKGFLSIIREYRYQHDLPWEIKNHPISYASGLVQAMGIYFLENNTKNHKGLVVQPGTVLHDLYNVHLADGRNFMKEYYYPEGVTVKDRQLWERTYEYSAKSFAVTEEKEATVLPVPVHDYCNFIFGDSELHQVLINPFNGVPPGQELRLSYSLEELARETYFKIKPGSLKDLAVYRLGTEPLIYSLTFTTDDGQAAELRISRTTIDKDISGVTDVKWAQTVDRIGQYPEYLAFISDDGKGVIRWPEDQFICSITVNDGASEEILNALRLTAKASWENDE